MKNTIQFHTKKTAIYARFVPTLMVLGLAITKEEKAIAIGFLCFTIDINWV
jgi:hypothetical protein